MVGLGAIALGVAGLGLGYLVSKSMTPDAPDYNSMMQSMRQDMQKDAQAATAVNMPQVPENPAAPVDPQDTAAVANPEAEDERRKLEEAARQAAQVYNPTGGLGLTSNASGKAKGLGGV